jgi:hypothetical protein
LRACTEQEILRGERKGKWLTRGVKTMPTPVGCCCCCGGGGCGRRGGGCPRPAAAGCGRPCGEGAPVGGECCWPCSHRIVHIT